MNKYIVWTSGNTGDYVNADRVDTFNDTLLFIQSMKDNKEKVVASYPKNYEYHEVKI